ARYVVSYQVPQAVAGTGVHTWSVRVAVTSGTIQTIKTVDGWTFVVNQEASSFGAGWSLSLQDQLIPVAPDSTRTELAPPPAIRVYGTGSWRFYRSLGHGSYASPAGGFGALP